MHLSINPRYNHEYPKTNAKIQTLQVHLDKC